MTSDTTALAERLLDAQVAFVTTELTGPTAADIVTAEVLEALAAVDDVLVGDLVDRDALIVTIGEVIDRVGDAPGIDVAVSTLVGVLLHLPQSEETDLGDVVDRAAISVAVDVLVGSETLREEVLRRLSSSPAVSALAMRFVSALVGDAVQQNRERAEKMPGVKSMLSVGDFAARQARGMAPKQLEKAVGNAADRSAQAAMERVSRALIDTFDDEAVQRAAMEVWDMHAQDRIDGLRGYLTDDETDEVAATGLAVWSGLHGTPWFRSVLDAAVTAFFEQYGEVTVGGLLGDFGLDHEVIATVVARHAPQVAVALQDAGALEPIVRRRLAPFWSAASTIELLADA